MGYASRTGTRRNLAALRAAGWRLLVSPAGCVRHEGFSYALDNGAWSAYQAGTTFDADAFERAVSLLGDGADWIVLPDIVQGGCESLELSRSWFGRLRGVAPLLVAVQDGMLPDDVRDLVHDGVGIFVGGSTEWKESSLSMWGRLRAETGCYLHVGRVNTRRRIKLCALAGASSFDGTSVSMFATNITKLDAERKQLTLWSGGEV